MYSNTIQARIEATLKELYKVHDTVFKPAVMYTMYSNIRAYFIILDKDNKAQLLNAFDPRVVEHEDKLELVEIKVGDSFDADFAEAITQIPAPSEDLKGKIVDVIEKGYKLGDKIIRFPKVVIGN